MIRFSFSVLSWLFRLLVVLYFLGVLGILGVRYVLLPNINNWQEPIAQSVSSVLNTAVRFGHLQASWSSRNPRFEINHLEILDPNGRTVVLLPSVRAELDWRSLFSLQPRFVSLVVQNSHFDVRRDIYGRIWALGQAFDPGDAEPVQPGAQARFVHWLLEQQNLDLINASVRWADESRNGQPLDLQGVSAQWRASRHVQRFSMSALPPSGLGERLDVSFDLSTIGVSEDGRFTLLGSRGTVFFQVPGMRPDAWAPWVDLPEELGVSTLGLAAWVPVVDGLPETVIARLAVNQGHWALDGQGEIRLASGHALVVAGWDWLVANLQEGTAEGVPVVSDSASPIPEFRAVPATSDSGEGRDTVPEGLAYWFDVSDIGVDLPDVFQKPFSVTRLNGYGKFDFNTLGAPDLVFHALDLHNTDLEASLSGRWQSGGDGPEGIIDLQGRIPYILIDAIDDYLPLEVDHDARTWMAESLKEGTIEQATLLLQGDLHHFPFQSASDKGNFLIQGRVVNALIDYLPASNKEPGWPALRELNGHLRLHRADLAVHGETAVMLPAEEQQIHLQAIQARIPDIEQNSVLSVQGQTRGDAQAYLALAHDSPLGALLDGVLDEARAQGQWQVPVELVIPLLNSEDSRVSGHILFEKSGLQLMPELPELTALDGRLEFTESRLKADTLKGKALGGDVTLSGGLGAGQKGLVVQGQAADKALHTYLGVQGARRIKGAVPYRLRIDRDKSGSLVLEASSDLRSVALDLPAPLAKAQGQSMPVSLDWRRRDAASRLLSVKVADKAVLSLLQRNGRPAGPFFSAGALGVGKKPALPGSGLMVDVAASDLDLDAWRLVVNEFSSPLSGEPVRTSSQNILPSLAQLRVQSAHARLFGQALDHFTITAQRPQLQQWRVDVVSSQVAGTVFWRDSDQGVPGRVDAKFDRLALGSEVKNQGSVQGSKSATATGSDAVSASFDEELDIPEVSLYVKNFRLYGHEVGELTVMGLNQERGRLWRLDELRLEHSAATLTGSGMWRLSGPDRGLKLSASADVRDLGAYLEQIGHEGVMADGKGKVSADIVWRDMPWAFDRAYLDGELKFELSNGRFMTVNSYTARLLALLSLQSVSRLARLEFKPAQVAEDGFSFDTLGGTVQLQKGILHTRDYRVTGPVATIVIEGTVNLVREALDLEAVVVPNLDVGGAAIAAGIAINPIIGVGAFLTQWLLQAPLSKAMSVQYHIEGSWSNPVIRETAAREGRDKKSAVPPQ